MITKEKVNTIHSRLHISSTKGFVSIYFLIILLAVSFYCSCIVKSVNQYIEFRKDLDAFRRLNNAEALAILRVKRSFKDYSEEDERLRYEGCNIELYYSGTTAEIIISYKNQIRERTLIYDEEFEVVKKYY